jgi:hypothetical protein
MFAPEQVGAKIQQYINSYIKYSVAIPVYILHNYIYFCIHTLFAPTCSGANIKLNYLSLENAFVYNKQNGLLSLQNK